MIIFINIDENGNDEGEDNLRLEIYMVLKQQMVTLWWWLR